jgi:arabinose-5-phosphate isomerase
MKKRTVKQILTIEKKSIEENINRRVLQAVEKAAEIISKRKKGRVAVMGIGKSGLVARKIASTLSSTGTPSFFTHPGEALHGDIGMLTKEDTILVLSLSGELEELSGLFPSIKKMKIPLISITGRENSHLAKISDYVIPIKITQQACPFNLAPTSSTTVMMVIGDAIAILLMQKKNLTKDKLALLHPGGVLGKKLTMQVKDIMRKGRNNPKISKNAFVKDALLEMTRTRLGAVSIVDKNGKLIGFFTDGDLRREIQKNPSILSNRISRVMTKKPFSITEDTPAWKAAQIISRRNFDNIPVVSNCGKVVGIIDERDLLTEGLID